MGMPYDMPIQDNDFSMQKEFDRNFALNKFGLTICPTVKANNIPTTPMMINKR
tara:strand:- start:4859 stop:5017 length:159 start_codon:yes stop_codon:yes gene_type:complete